MNLGKTDVAVAAVWTRFTKKFSSGSDGFGKTFEQETLFGAKVRRSLRKVYVSEPKGRDAPEPIARGIW